MRFIGLPFRFLIAIFGYLFLGLVWVWIVLMTPLDRRRRRYIADDWVEMYYWILGIHRP